MRIAVARELEPGETRVAATPETVKKMKALGADVAVEPGAGANAGIPDAEFTTAGAAAPAAPSKMPMSFSRCVDPHPPSFPVTSAAPW